ncbi:putative transcription factor interactor and regulator FHA-SMAD family [Helianthus annuus]|nr:putative transcription factor interactor and regulator FHA-SMAD family [Helianthus annuus]KAJ0747868.1 putative transcription factor interactor and regulator FHA-SMAD family [Helianthus annuus]
MFTGTSLESLARGDVKFSKQFTIQQLQDRWLAILYDPVVAAESSARMLQFEHADSAPVLKTDHLGNIEEDVIPVCGKRKPESIRKRFYAMQKKLRRDYPPAEPPAEGFCEPLQINEPVDLLTYEAHDVDIVNLDVNDVNQYYNGDNNCNEEESDGFEEILELLEAKGPESLPPIIDEPNSENFDEYPIIPNLPNVNFGDAELENQIVTNNTNNYLINDLFDLSMEEDDIPLMDADGNLIDMSYIDDMSSHWLDSPNSSSNNAKHDSVFVNEFLNNNNNNKSRTECDNQETKTLDGLLVTSFKPPVTSAIICTLNTEDPEIPSNDDVFLLNLVPSTSQEMQMDAYKPPLPPQHMKRDFRVSKPIVLKNNRYEQSQFSSPIIGSQFRSEIQVGQSQRIKQDFPHEDRSQVCPAIISRSNLFPACEKAISIKSEQEMHHVSSVRTVFDNKIGGSDIVTNHAQLNPMTTVQQEEAFNVEIDSTEVNNLSLVAVNEEAISSQSDDDGDYDMPCFSDVEAMILDEDTSLDEQHLYMTRIGSSELLQTFKYENAETQKAIMRLEQAADAFVKRDIKSHGAFAILQGRHMKYYVKKPEVLIGRATEEFRVDIDLGREGQNSRVSRRQAILHMDHEGSFHLKNLSKYSIFINSMELATNQSISLTSSCLIEIKGMAFLFETNEASIKQYVNSTKNKTVMVDT